MLLRKTAWFWKSGLAVISFVLIFSISGCSDTPPEEDTVSETVIDVQAVPDEYQENAERNYKHLYQIFMIRLQRKISWLIWKQFEVL